MSYNRLRVGKSRIRFLVEEGVFSSSPRPEKTEVHSPSHRCVPAASFLGVSLPGLKLPSVLHVLPGSSYPCQPMPSYLLP